MVSLSAVRTHNSSLKSLPPGLVAVFVGGTSGIGFSTAREFVRNTTAPHVYLVGRNQTQASRIIDELHQINPSSQLSFIKSSDVSLLKNVDEVCKEIKEKEAKVNLLFMTIGYTTFQGRNETAEGLDRKFSVHYYARMRFIQNLSPLLTAAANDADSKANLSRVVSVLDPNLGRASSPDFSDLSLKHTFTLKNCAVHASAMNNFALEYFAKTYLGTSFIHAFPAGVETGAMRELGPIFNNAFKIALKTVFRPFAVGLVESGERHLFASTAPQFTPKAKTEEVKDIAKGSDDVPGSGSYHLNLNGEAMGESKKLETMRADGAVQKTWEHTEDVFKKICDEGEKY